MKKSILTFALMTAFGAFILTSYAAANTTTESTVVCEGEHKCDDKCKKDKNGKCAEAKAESGDKAAASCCKKGEKSCKGKKAKNGKGKNQSSPKSAE